MKPRFSLQARQPGHRMIQNYFLIWVDENINVDDETFQNALSRLQHVIKQIKVCTTPAQCIEVLNDLNDGKVFIIVSGTLGKHLVPRIHGIACVDVIYIFCENKDRHQEWANGWVKIRGAFTSLQAICESLKKAARECDHDSIPMSFVPRSKTQAMTSDEENVNQLSPTFMYSVLFKEIILEIEDDESKSLKDLIVYCRKHKIAQDELKIFEQQYQIKSPIWLYTCEMFLYSMLNRSLRSLDMEAMTKMAFFIRKLHRQLEQLHEEQSDVFKEKIIVYRGQGLIPQDFEQLMNTKGGLLSFNNFLSTSKKEDVAMAFAHGALANKDNVAVLFIMTVDPSKILISTTPYAIIDEYSAIPQEQEILFSMHTIFHVADIRKAAKFSRLWEVHLTLTDQNDPQLATLTHRMREEIHDKGWLRMGKLMLKVGHFGQAEELYNGLLADCSDDCDRATIYQELGRTKRYQGEYKKAAEFYEKSLEIYLTTLPEDHPSLANTYNNIGLVSNNMGDYSKALTFYEKAHQIKEKSLPPNHPKLATSYHNMGQVYNSMGDYSKALEFHEIANKINQQALPSNHPHVAIDYDNIGLVYNNIGEYSKALKLYEKAHQIKEKALPPNHPNLATSHLHLATSYQRMGNYKDALKSLENALRIQQKSLSQCNPDCAVTYNRIGEVYCSMTDYTKALEYFEQSLSIRQQALPEKHPDLGIIYSNIGDIHRSMGNYEIAISFLEKALAIQENVHCNPSDCAATYTNLAETYREMENYSQALKYFDKALQIRENKLPRDHPDLATLYHNMAKLYLATQKYTMAMKSVQKALEIAQKKLSATHPNLLEYRKTLEKIEKKL